MGVWPHRRDNFGTITGQSKLQSGLKQIFGTLPIDTGKKSGTVPEIPGQLATMHISTMSEEGSFRTKCGHCTQNDPGVIFKRGSFHPPTMSHNSISKYRHLTWNL